jgi:hypothetical protein
MRNLLLLLSLVATAPAFAAPVSPNKATPSKLGNGFVYESLTKVGDKAIVVWPRVKVGGELAYVNRNSGSLYYQDLGHAICKAYGYRSGNATYVVVTDANYVKLEKDGSVNDFGFGFGQYSAAYSVTCSNAPAYGEPVNY